jgi:hypothetical protein
MPTAGGDQKSQRESLILEGHGFSRAANSTALAGEIGLGNRGLIGDSFLRAPSREGLERAAGRTADPSTTLHRKSGGAKWRDLLFLLRP